MSKKEKLIARLLPFPKDFTYDEMRTLLCEAISGKTNCAGIKNFKTYLVWDISNIKVIQAL